MDDDIIDHLKVRCVYHDLKSIANIKFSNSVMHLNIRSLCPKIGELEALINLTGSPKVLMLTETWLTNTSLPHNIVNYSFLSSLRLKSRGDGVGMFVNNSLQDHVITYLLIILIIC